MSKYKCDSCKGVFELNHPSHSELKCTSCGAELEVENDIFKKESVVIGFSKQKGYPLFVLMSIVAFISVVLLDLEDARIFLAGNGISEMVLWSGLAFSLTVLAFLGAYMTRKSNNSYEVEEIITTKKK